MPNSALPLPRGCSRRGVVAGAAALLLVGQAAASVTVSTASAAVPLPLKVAPVAAPVGTGVTVGGENLAGTTAVTFLGDTSTAADDVVAPHFIVLDPKKVVVQVPPGAASGPVRVTNADGSADTGAIVLTVLKAPAITSLSVTSGKPGDDVVITGTDLLGTKGPKIFFGGKAAAPLAAPVPTQESVTVKVPAGLAGGPTTVSVVTSGGTVKTNFLIAPMVTAVKAVSGSTSGGTVISVLGAGFTGVDAFPDDAGTAGVNEALDGVTVGGNRVTKLIAVNDKEVVVEVPPGLDAAAPVVVRTNHDGAVSTSGSAVTFGYVPTPVVTSVSQNWNAVNSPTEITVTGKGFDSGTVVKVGGLDPAGITLTGDTFTLTPPVGLKAALSAITLTNTVAGVPYVASVPFSWVAAPAVLKLVPAAGPVGTPVLVSGTGFVTGTTAKFGGVNASCVVSSAVLLRCVAPAGIGATSDVVVTNPVGSSTPSAASAFALAATGPTVAAGDPAVAALLPAYGTTGSTVELKGAGLNLVTKVEFTGASTAWVEASKLLVVAPGRAHVVVPAGTARGELRLTWAGGRIVTYTKIFTPTVRPSIASIDVVGDPTYVATPGDLLTIKGAGLVIPGVKPAVTIDGKPVTVLAKPVPHAKTIVVKVPSVTGGRGEVVVSTPLGSAVADQQLFFGPDVKSAKPPTYSTTGGTIVTISGSGFTGADAVTVYSGRRSAVTFGGVPVAKMVVVNDKTLVVTTAPGSKSVDPVVVTTQHDTKFATSLGAIKSVLAPIPSVTAVSPSTGPTGGSNPPVTLTGTNLALTSAVRFGSSLGSVVSAAPDGTSLVVVPPAEDDPGPVAISVVNVDEGDELSTTVVDGYTYELQAAVVTGKSAGTALAGTIVTVTGSSFVDVTSVRFGAAEAAFTVANANTIFATVPATPAGAAGTVVDVTVVNRTGDPSTASPATADDWTWDNSPTVTGITKSGEGGGSTATITGSGFNGVTAVRFGYTYATAFTVVNDTTITATVPNTPLGSGGQTVDLVVELGAFLSRPSAPSADDWTWMSGASVTAMSAHTGPAGTSVTVTGAGFVGIRSVTAGGRAVTGYTVISPTQMTVVIQASANGATAPGRTGDVVITNASGLVSTASPATADDWTFQ